MATLLLSVAGSVIGGAIGGPAGAVIGRALGGLAGAAVDQTLLASTAARPDRVGPRLTAVDITGSTEGAAMTRLVGRTRLSGQMIWATRFREDAVTDDSGGGKGLGGGGGSTTTYRYFANFAVALCEGPVDRIGRIWADGRELDQESDDVVIRKHRGRSNQGRDSLIEAKEGTDATPGYRGVAYVVFENMALETYGNRMPVITAEVYRCVGDLEPLVPAVALIPGTTEFGYDPGTVNRLSGQASYTADNRHTLEAPSDLVASLDLLGSVAENCDSIVLVVAWFGTDLRCGHCEIRPKVENRAKTTMKDGMPYAWRVAGEDRATADLVSQLPGDIPAFGGSPNDASVIACIKELKARGYHVTLYPFVMMDIEAGNALPDPYSDNAGATGQPTYPWRGRITCSPAPGHAGSPDRTAAAAAQVATFAGTAQASDFAASLGTVVDYTGPAEWSYRRFVLHMATLADLAARAGAPVDAFTIGSEMVGLTTVRSSASAYPFVDALVDLLGEARAILGGGTKLGYAADWSEYHSHRPADGSGDVHFHLDPLWSDTELDFVGIDNYMPLSDWRDGTDHLDYANTGPTSIHDRAYLTANIAGGEYYDWYYARQADRDAQIRTPIADGAYGKPWVFRNKDIRGWWENAHHDRPGGSESGAPTGWTPEGKPIWFTEFGCPAVDKGPNQPNVFYDPKSSESVLPHYSSGARDDAAQRAYLQAMLDYWTDPANNPSSGVYSGRMVNRERMAVWAWDARMGPSFPQDETTWADAPNWEYGHWISGRLGAAPARETVNHLLARYDIPLSLRDVRDMAGVADAVVVDRLMSIRAVLDAIQPAYLFQAFESQGKLRFASRIGAPVIRDVGLDDLVDIGAPDGGSGSVGTDRYARTRGQETELPDAVKISYGDPVNDDLSGGVEARRSDGGSMRVEQVSLPVVMGEARARALAETLLFDAWVGRERLEFALPPAHLDLDPGDVIRFAPGGDADGQETWRIAEIDDGAYRRLRAVRVEANLFDAAAMPRRARPVVSVPALGAPLAVFLDGALLQDADDPHAGYVAAFVAPWPGSVAVYKSPAETGFVLDTMLPTPATVGTTAFDFYSGPLWRWDRVNDLYVDLEAGTLASAEAINVLAGANALAVETAEGEWEIVQFQTAELIDVNRYKLSLLLRGQRGSEHAMRDPVAAGARVLVLNAALRQPDLSDADMGLPYTWRVGPATRDVSDASFGAHTVTMAGKGRRPLAPVRLTGRRDPATGDWTLAWIRRTRIGGDSWNQTEVPLAEDSEAYELEILDAPGGTVLRAVALTEPRYLYTAAAQTADFGSPQWTVPIRVRQMSASFGAGAAAEALTWDH
ncbi:baseplate multidomain protein megatron [Microbaculum sp. FT89]|uniref:baseplate multidomain protein megatron n=1 Tax=Microbaculum sp. FT89 TaxID=3447298 RepID=UPI003F536DA4